MKYKKGDKVRVIGTKEGSTYDWDNWFGKYGCKKGDTMTIISFGKIIRGNQTYFMEKGCRPTSSGFLTEGDFMKSSWKSRCIQPKAL